MATLPDLLHAEPRPRRERAALVDQLTFAFENGAGGGAFERVADALPTVHSEWDPECFSDQVFLDELVASCFPVIAEGVEHAPRAALLGCVLSRPPIERSDVEARQAVLRELLHDGEVRADLEATYMRLRRLRQLLEEGEGLPLSGVRRKLEILATLEELLETMSDCFEGASSALRRLRSFAREVVQSESFERLGELLDYDDNMATVEVRLRLGYDGRVRGFQLMAAQPNEQSRFVPSPIRRLFTRLWLFLRGYRFGEDEVLIRFVDEVFSDLREEVCSLLHVLGDAEVYLAALGFRAKCAEHGLDVCLPEVVEPPPLSTGEIARRELTGLFNPLLLLQSVTPRPCDLPGDRHDALVVITGPNSGGKTRLLQAVAIAQMLGQAGLFVPASRARLVRAPTMFVSLIDEIAAGQREGRLGTELLRIRRLFEQLHPGTLVVLDELCSGTNPSEGEAIFEMVVSLLPRLRPQVFITTHFLGLAARLESERPVAQLEFMQVELDAEHHPTYRFVPGVANTSLAQQVAERLGVTRDELETLVDRRAGPRPAVRSDDEAAQ